MRCKNYEKMEIEIKINDLQKEVYTFYISNTCIFLNTYSLLIRENKRKRTYRKLKGYDRLNKRESNMEEDDVILTDEFKNYVLDYYIKEIISKMSVKKWSDRWDANHVKNYSMLNALTQSTAIK